MSILQNGPQSFAGRVMGVMISNGHDGTLLDRLTGAVTAAGGKVKMIAPRVSGALDDRGDLREAQFSIAGGPSVAILLGRDDEALVTAMPQAQSFLRDAFAHGKFIGHALANRLFETSGLARKQDEGCFDLGLIDDGDTMAEFIASCGRLRHWPRQGML